MTITRASRGAFLIAFVLLMASGGPGAAAEADVLKLQENWRRALLAADVAALEAIYGDDLIYVHSDGRVQNKQQFLAPMKEGKMRFSSFTGCDTPRVRSYESAGVVSACYELRGGSGASSRHLFMTTHVKDGDRWRIVAQQTTRLPEKP